MNSNVVQHEVQLVICYAIIFQALFSQFTKNITFISLTLSLLLLQNLSSPSSPPAAHSFPSSISSLSKIIFLLLYIRRERGVYIHTYRPIYTYRLWGFPRREGFLKFIEMSPSMRDVQMTATNGDSSEDFGDCEEVRLLDSYDEENSGENLRRIQVRVTGMTCAACSTSVEGALMSLNGVVKASVALLQNKADVVFDPHVVKVHFLSLLLLSVLFCSKFKIRKCMLSSWTYISIIGV